MGSSTSVRWLQNSKLYSIQYIQNVKNIRDDLKTYCDITKLTKWSAEHNSRYECSLYAPVLQQSTKQICMGSEHRNLLNN